MLLQDFKRLLLLTLTALLALLISSSYPNTVVSAESFTIIGTGTPASCQSNSAVNAFSATVTAGGTIDFYCGPNPVTINVNTSYTDQTVVINGNDLIYLSGEDQRQLFYVTNGGTVTLNNIVLMDGATNDGGAAFIGQNGTFIMNGGIVMSSQATNDGGAFYNQGSLTLNNVTIVQNQAAGFGGGIHNDAGYVDILNSHVNQNQAQHGGAVFNKEGFLYVHQSVFRGNQTNNQGAIYVDGFTLITNSTFTTNQAPQGGALFITESVNIFNSTFYLNFADIGGAIFKAYGGSGVMRNTIVADSLNSAGTAPSLNCEGNSNPLLVSYGRNIISDGSCLPNPSVTGDLFHTDPDLGPWIGAPVWGYLPNPNSQAIGYGLECLNVDQRNYPRPLGDGCEVGSLEVGNILFLPAVIR